MNRKAREVWAGELRFAARGVGLTLMVTGIASTAAGMFLVGILSWVGLQVAAHLISSNSKRE